MTPPVSPCGPLCGPMTGGAESLPLLAGSGRCGPVVGGVAAQGFRRTEGRKEKQEKALALLCAGQSHPARSAGGFRGRRLTLFQPTKPAIDAVSGKTGVFPRR